MKFEVLRGDFLDAVQKVQYSASGKGLMPILSGMKIDALEGELVLSATDLESYSISSCVAKVEEKGSCVANLKTIQDYLRDSSDEKLSLNQGGNELVIEGSKSRVRLFTMPVEDFPSQPILDVLVAEGIKAEGFLKAVQKVSRAASKDEKRPTLTGIFMEMGQDEIRLVSTDSYRLALCKVSGEEGVKEEGDYIIPASSLVNLARVVGREETIHIYRDENRGQIKMETGGIKQIVRLIEGKFPKYGQFIPEETKINIEVGKKELLDALKRIALISSTVKISAKQGLMVLEGESREVGEGKEELETAHQGEEIEIAFNVSFLEDGLQALEGERALIEVNEPLKPGLIREKEGKEFKYVIMPIRL